MAGEQGAVVQEGDHSGALENYGRGKLSRGDFAELAAILHLPIMAVPEWYDEKESVWRKN